MLAAQGSDLKAFHRKLTLGSTATTVLEVRSGKTGYISKCDARLLGEILRDLGAGRLTKESSIHVEVGLDCIAKPGEWMKPSSTLCRIHATDAAQAKAMVRRIKVAFKITPQRPSPTPLIAEIVR